MKNGRPSKYKGEKTIEKARKYIASCKDVFTDGKKSVNLPCAEGLALELGISRKLLYIWAEKYKKFFHILEKLNETQVKKLLDNGLSGNYNATIAKLVLAKHGYKEESKQEHSIHPQLQALLEKVNKILPQ